MGPPAFRMEQRLQECQARHLLYRTTWTGGSNTQCMEWASNNRSWLTTKDFTLQKPGQPCLLMVLEVWGRETTNNFFQSKVRFLSNTRCRSPVVQRQPGRFAPLRCFARGPRRPTRLVGLVDDTDVHHAAVSSEAMFRTPMFIMLLCHLKDLLICFFAH